MSPLGSPMLVSRLWCNLSGIVQTYCFHFCVESPLCCVWRPPVSSNCHCELSIMPRLYSSLHFPSCTSPYYLTDEAKNTSDRPIWVLPWRLNHCLVYMRMNWGDNGLFQWVFQCHITYLQFLHLSPNNIPFPHTMHVWDIQYLVENLPRKTIKHCFI